MGHWCLFRDIRGRMWGIFVLRRFPKKGKFCRKHEQWKVTQLLEYGPKMITAHFVVISFRRSEIWRKKIVISHSTKVYPRYKPFHYLIYVTILRVFFLINSVTFSFFSPIFICPLIYVNSCILCLCMWAP